MTEHPIINQNDGKIYWSMTTRSVIALIPKKNSKGFLKQPVGHHVNSLSNFITDLGYDCCGLDGYLKIETGFTCFMDWEPLVKKIGKFLKRDIVEVNSDHIFDFILSNGKR